MKMSDQNLKKILIKQREEYQRYLRVITEGFEHQVKLIAESLTGMQKQLVGIRDMVARNTEDIEVMKIDMEMMKTDIEIMKGDMALIRRDLKEKTGRDEISLIEARVARLERTLHHRK